jgi:Lipase (class 3)
MAFGRRCLPSSKQSAGRGKNLTVTGHSLGSTLATLAVPDAVNSYMQVRNYNSASPMVGLKSFSDYYDSLTVIGGAPGLLTDTYRLVNAADTVPGVPNNIQPQPPKYQYVPVGTAVSFNADYGAEKKNQIRVAATVMHCGIRQARAIQTMTPATGNRVSEFRPY